MLKRFCLWVILALTVLPVGARAASCGAAATQGTAPAAWQTYCWLDFSSYSDILVRSSAGQAFSFTLMDGSALSFTLKLSPVASAPLLVANPAPSWPGAAVGNTAFIGIPGKPILYQQGGGTDTLTFSAIKVTPAPGVPALSAYSLVAADAESSNTGESLSFVTDGSGWVVLDKVPPISGATFPSISGVGTTSVTENGADGFIGGYIIGTNSPSTFSATLVGGGLQGVMFAIRSASLRLSKQIVGARVSAADQFKLDLTSTLSGGLLGSGSTFGIGLGPFPVTAAALSSGLPMTLSESMAVGSTNLISHYLSSLTCTNAAGGSSTPLPSNVITTSYNFGGIQFGDAVQCVFTNTPYPHVTLQKALGASGRRLPGDQFVMAISSGAAVVATTTTTGTGTTVSTGATPQIQATVGTSYGLAETPSGTTDPTQYSAVMACVNASGGSTTVLPTTTPGTITPVMGDVVTCTITNSAAAPNARLTVVKTATLVSDPLNGATNPKLIPGAVVRYAISVTNTGTLPVDASSIVLTDPLPANVVYDASSPAQFANGTPGSGLNAFNPASMVTFSGPVSAIGPYSYAPNTAGYDSNVKGVRIAPTGTMAATTSAGQPSFTVSFLARIN